MNRFLCVLMWLLVAGCHTTRQADIISFNDTKNYPYIDLKLSDVADIEYIKLNHPDQDIFLRGFSNKGRNLFIGNNRMYILDGDRRIVIYDRRGNFISMIDTRGRGPREYLSVPQFAVDTLTNNLIIFDQQGRKNLFYDLDGTFREEFLYENRKMTSFFSMGMLHSHLIAYTFTRTDSLLAMINPMKGERLDIPLTYAKPYIHDYDGILAYSNLIDTKDGKFLFNFRSDTLYYIDTTLRVTPRFVDKTPYGSDNIQMYPTVETDKYVFFVTLFSTINVPNGKLKFHVYDKELRQFFRLKQFSTRPNDRNSYQLALINDFIEINWQTITMNYQYAATFLEPDFLIENYQNLPSQLKELTEDIDMFDNPILMLIKFRD